MKESLQLVNGWTSIVSTISSNKAEKNRTGQLLAAHSRIIDLKNGILLIETDHPAYIQMLRIYKDYILRGLKKKFPELEVNTLSFRLKGSEIKLHDVEENKVPADNKNVQDEAVLSNYEMPKNMNADLKSRLELLRDALDEE